MAGNAITHACLPLVAQEGLEAEIRGAIHPCRQLDENPALLIGEPPKDAPGKVLWRLLFLGLFRNPVDVGKGIVDSPLGGR